MIAQLKFVAIFLVPSFYPSLLIVCSTIAAFFGPPLATFSAPVPGSEWPFVLNAIAWLGVMTILATLALTVKKLFGRQPSLNSILSGLVSVGVLKEFREEQHRRDRGLEEQISKVRHETDEALNSALVREGERGKEIQLMRDIVSRLQERTETHIRKLDRYDERLDKLLNTWRQAS